MLPIVLTKKQKVLIVGAGRACEIKLVAFKVFPIKIMAGVRVLKN